MDGNARAVDQREGITVALCTFRRSVLADALRSLKDQDSGPLPVSVLVIDNDDIPSARALAIACARTFDLDLRYVHAPGRNISIARNAALDAAKTRWLAFLDDDETATPDWLRNLLRPRADKVAAIFGPVRAIYGEWSPDWMRRGDFHSINVTLHHGDIVTGYTSNVLLDLDHPAIHGRRFDLALGRSGGEDTVFFHQVWKAGGNLRVAQDAIVNEIATPERSRLSWLLKRRFRYGQTHARMVSEENQSKSKAIFIISASAKVLYCTLLSILTVFLPTMRAYWLLRGALHAGAIAHILGIGDLRIYGITKDNAEKKDRGRS